MKFNLKSKKAIFSLLILLMIVVGFVSFIAIIDSQNDTYDTYSATNQTEIWETEEEKTTGFELKDSVGKAITVIIGIIFPSFMIVSIVSKAIAFGKGEKGAKEELVNTFFAIMIFAITVLVLIQL